MTEREFVECNYLRQQWINEASGNVSMSSPETGKEGEYAILLLSHYDMASGELVGASEWLAVVTGEKTYRLLHWIHKYLPRNNRIAYLVGTECKEHSTNKTKGRILWHSCYRLCCVHKRFMDCAITAWENSKRYGEIPLNNAEELLDELKEEKE